MLVFTVSGKAGAGKDYFAEVLADRFKWDGRRVLITHYADLLKYILQEYCEWDGNKDERGRRLLQYVGTDLFRNSVDENYWIDFLISVLRVFKNQWDIVIIPDARFPNEITRMARAFNTRSILVRRNFESGLETAEARHESENALDGFDFDFYIDNDVDYDRLCQQAQFIVNMHLL